MPLWQWQEIQELLFALVRRCWRGMLKRTGLGRRVHAPGGRYPSLSATPAIPDRGLREKERGDQPATGMQVNQYLIAQCAPKSPELESPERFKGAAALLDCVTATRPMRLRSIQIKAPPGDSC